MRLLTILFLSTSTLFSTINDHLFMQSVSACDLQILQSTADATLSITDVINSKSSVIESKLDTISTSACDLQLLQSTTDSVLDTTLDILSRRGH